MSALAVASAEPRLVVVPDVVAPNLVGSQRQLPELWVPTGKRGLLLYAMCHSAAGPLRYEFLEAGERYTWRWRDEEMSVLIPHDATAANRAVNRARTNPRAPLELVAVVATLLESPETWTPVRAAERLAPGKVGGGHLGPIRDWLALLRDGCFQWAGDRTGEPLFTPDNRPTELLRKLNDVPEKPGVRSGIIVPGHALIIREAPKGQHKRRATSAELARIRLATGLYIRWNPGKKKGSVKQVRLQNLIETWAGLRWDGLSPTDWFDAVQAELIESRATPGGYGLAAPAVRHPVPGRTLLAVGPSWQSR